MRPRQKRFLVAIGAAVPMVLLVRLGFAILFLRANDWPYVQERIRRMGGAQAVLDTAMTLRSRHMPYYGGVTVINSNAVDWPMIFSSGDVYGVGIFHDCVQIDFRKRRALLAFEEGDSGYGTRRIIDRLWYWGGEESGLKRKRHP